MTPTEYQEKINSYILEVEEEKKLQKLNDGDFCVIIYSGRNLNKNRWVKFIYRNVDDFKTKALKDIESIDEMYSIDLQMWVFD